ncbi:hypothetical protein A5705_10480 [Mycobacterium sp. E787]|nr:hypothetical protein A5705_10480 [Mycobacterium sp. E787]
MKPFVRFLPVTILATLAAATLLMPSSPSGPRTLAQRAVALVFIVSLAGMALVWALTWPTRVQSQVFSTAATLGIAATCLIESDPRSGMLGCAAFDGQLGRQQRPAVAGRRNALGETKFGMPTFRYRPAAEA